MMATSPTLEEQQAASRRATQKAITQFAVDKVQVVPEMRVFLIPSTTNPDVVRQVSLVDYAPKSGDLIRFRCTCDAGQHRSDYAVPCWHAAAAGLFLLREMLVYVKDALYYRSNLGRSS